MKRQLRESLPAMIPQYPVEIAGHHLTLRFDVNINKTKKGIKLQFVMKDIPEDPRQVQEMANEIGTELQEKFGAANMQIVYDVENPYKNVIGFLLPLPSLANSIIKSVFEGQAADQEVEADDNEAGSEAGKDVLPSKELPPAEEEPIREWIMKMAGLKSTK